jgi:2-iminobutanoate/2-iminopropanoate deaminase
MNRRIVSTPAAPRAVGPYSQGVVGAGLVWASGQIGLDPQTGQLVEGGVEAETRQALRNVAAVLEAAGANLGRVVRATVYLIDMDDFERVNRVYAEAFDVEAPARACVAVRALPRGARVEIEVVALS